MTPPTGPKPPPISIHRPPQPVTPPTRPEPMAPDPDPLHIEPEPVVGTVGGPTTLSFVVLALTAVVLGLALGVWLARSVATPRPARSTVPIARDVSERRGDASAGLPAAPRPRPPGAALGGPGLSRRVAPALPETATTLAGWATWYEVAAWHGAAGPELRRALGPGWRGQRVRVCAHGRCVTTALTDWCACGDRHGIPTLIDLARADFARLASPSAGVVLVTIARVGAGAPLHLPATDATP
jgi:hypothetical protein